METRIEAAMFLLQIMNYELGIVIPLRTTEEVETVACWKRPARKYVDGVDRAWVCPCLYFSVVSICLLPFFWHHILCLLP